MSKRNKIIYWIFTIWMSFGMLSSAILQFIQHPDQVKMFEHLGYPVYFLHMLAIYKILGVIVTLIPKFPVLKEWAYAGFIFAMSGAFFSHLAMQDPFGETFPPVFLLIITMISWYFRPADRKPAKVA